MTALEVGCPSATGVLPVVVEVFGLSVCGGTLRWRVARAVLPGLAEPDVLARELAGVQRGAPPGVVLHSTSWRHTGAELALTYALFPDTSSRGPLAGRRRGAGAGTW